MAQVQLKYQTSKTVNVEVLRVWGASQPDHVQKFPGLVHTGLDGSLTEQIAGSRRCPKVEFNVLSDADIRKALAWWMSTDRQLICLADAPVLIGVTAVSGGSLLASKNYRYKVSAVDSIGESIASVATTGDTTTSTDKTMVSSWPSVTDAQCYKIYRQNNTDGGHWFLIDYTRDTSYTDDGSITDALALKDLGTDVPPISASVINVITPNEWSLEWRFGTELNRILTLELQEATIFLPTDLFPV